LLNGPTNHQDISLLNALHVCGDPSQVGTKLHAPPPPPFSPSAISPAVGTKGEKPAKIETREFPVASSQRLPCIQLQLLFGPKAVSLKWGSPHGYPQPPNAKPLAELIKESKAQRLTNAQ
jgi:hypothetical protein